METHAKSLLSHLLLSAEKQGAGVRSRRASLTSVHLKKYASLVSLEEKRLFESVIVAARAAGAVTIKWDKNGDRFGFIERIDLNDINQLAAFLGQSPHEEKLATASGIFSPYIDVYPVLSDVLRRWAIFSRVRGYGVESVADWIDAIHAIDYAKNTNACATVSLPVREASARLFKDSKRIEKLIVPMDVLLSGSIEMPGRSMSEVLGEVGLFREEQPVLLAGNVVVRRSRVSACLDEPYAGFRADTVLGLGNVPDRILTVENLTTFHSMATRHCRDHALLIFTHGMPTPAWRGMYQRLLRDLPADKPVQHWGDLDEGGFRIAAQLAQDAQSAGHILKPWKMSPEEIPEDLRRKASVQTLARMRHFAIRAGWETLGAEVEKAGFVVEQEAVE